MAYSIASSAAKGETIHASLLPGDVACNVASHEGRLEGASVTTSDWTKPTLLKATPIALIAGAGQKYTLCFEKAAYALVSALCIAETC